jgi:hypothetical protein
VATGSYQPQLDEASLIRGDTVTIKVLTDLGREEVEYTGVWTNAEQETYPLIFPAAQAGMTGVAAGAATGSGGVATLEKEVTVSTGTAEDDLRSAMGGVKSAMGDFDAALEQLEADAAAAGQPKAEGDDDQGDDKEAGDDAGEPASRQRPAGSTPSADELLAWFNASDIEEPPAGGRPAGSPWTGTPGDPPPRPPVTYNNTAGQLSPKRRLLQLVALAATDGGIGPSEAHRDLVAEGYSTSLTTVQNWFKELLSRGILDQPGGARTAYLPGPKFPDTER